MHTHPPIDPDDPSGQPERKCENRRYQELNARPVKSFRAKVRSWIPNRPPRTNRQCGAR